MSMRCVAGETLCRTTQCPREFVCLENHSRPPCVAIGFRAEGLVIEKANHSKCAYASMWCGRLGAGRVVRRSTGLHARIEATIGLVEENGAHAAGSHAEEAYGGRARGDACDVSAVRRSGGPGTARGSSCALRTAGDRGVRLSA